MSYNVISTMLMYSVLDTIKFETSGRFKKTDSFERVPKSRSFYLEKPCFNNR